MTLQFSLDGRSVCTVLLRGLLRLQLNVRGKCQRSGAERHCVDEGECAPQERYVQPLQLAKDRLIDLFTLYDYLAIGLSACDGEVAWTSHHNALDHRLAAVLEHRAGLSAAR